MIVDVMAWNLRDGLARDEASAAIQERVLELAPDVAVFPEARPEGTPLNEAITANFEAHGYTTYQTDHNDEDTRKDRHGIVVIAKSEAVKDFRVVRLAGRNAIQLSLQHDVDFLGAHLVDRTPIADDTSVGGEKQRLLQTLAALEMLGNRAIAAGDFNAMSRSGLLARSLHAVKPLVQLLPSTEPQPGVKYNKIERLGSLSQRLTDMAAGTTLGMWEEAGFSDADQSHQATMGKGPLAFQLDHILARGILLSGDAEVHSSQGLSDHKILTATIKI